ncbi:MAG: hypothetical protein JW915_20365 [Chitinispirillaceae bacterium]|nr:hypothetical protein [Chitinispirillaceae bacterium]
MPPSIHTYIKTRLNEAFSRAFFYLGNPPLVPLTFSSITPDPSVDIATPFPLKISNALHIPVLEVSDLLLQNFSFDKNYILNTAENLYFRGYLNFRLAPSLVFHSVYETCLCDNPAGANCKEPSSDIINKISTLLKYTSPENFPRYDQLKVLTNKLTGFELRIARLIAVSGEDAIHSRGAHSFFIKHLLSEACLFYKACPVPVRDTGHSLLRIIIFKALINRIRILSVMQDLDEFYTGSTAER